MNSPLTRMDEGEIHRMWDLRKRALELLDIVNAEWKSDPQSLQCFDLRIASETDSVLTELKLLEAKHKEF